jgi:DNA-binding response OmpR family regulator
LYAINIVMSEARKKILYIEDDREIAALIAEELIGQGFEVCLAYDGRDGLDAILKERPDLVLADINLPVMSGFEVLEQLNSVMQSGYDIPFIFVTALADPDNRRRGRRLRADEFITKPIDYEVLNAIIAARLTGPRLSKHPNKLHLSLRDF